MIFRLMTFFLGVILSSIGVSFIIIYLNLLNMGYNFFQYVKFISSKLECLIVFLGLILIYISLHKGRG